MHPSIKILFIISTLLISACDKFQNRNQLSEHYDVIDSGYSAEEKFTWFDNDKVIFSGGKRYSDGSIEVGVYIWDIQKNKVERYATKGQLNCYYNGHIFYYSHKENDEEGRRVSFFKSGKFGEEEMYSVTIYKRGEKLFRKKPFEWVRNNFSCKKNDVPKEMANHVWVPLLEEHGFLEFGMHGKDMFSDENVFLHKANGEVIQLPFKRRDVYPLKGQYVPFKNAYFYWALLMTEEQRESWIATNCSKGWWIFPESGTAESECIPYTPWKKSHLVKPTKMGLFMVSDNYIGNNPRESGGYLYTEKQFIKAIKGQISEARISPDGCKVAVTHKLGSHINLKVKMTLKVVNICEEKN